MRLVCIQDACTRLHVPERTLRRLLATKSLPGIKFKRKWWIFEADLEAYLQKLRRSLRTM
ncbi:MAG: helix-turn-helix domain-containing protein [Blastocatellia bacterium]|nr:helix-turn-helix domain-containing protein [Blastocatellia bacterium]